VLAKYQYLYDFIEDLIDENWIEVRRQTRQFIGGKFYDYPVNAMQALKNLGIFKAVQILFDYGIAKIQYGIFKKPIKNFADYVYANFFQLRLLLLHLPYLHPMTILLP
jgi:hypothetical protein